MPEIRIAGPIENILSALEIMKSITSERKNNGWPIFQSDEEWRYETKNDGRVCRICDPWEGKVNGSEIPVEFPSYARWGRTHVKPGTHVGHPEIKPTNDPDSHEGCRCNLYWIDHLYTLLMRLDSELRNTVISVFESWGFRAA